MQFHRREIRGSLLSPFQTILGKEFVGLSQITRGCAGVHLCVLLCVCMQHPWVGGYFLQDPQIQPAARRLPHSLTSPQRACLALIVCCSTANAASPPKSSLSRCCHRSAPSGRAGLGSGSRLSILTSSVDNGTQGCERQSRCMLMRRSILIIILIKHPIQ